MKLKRLNSYQILSAVILLSVSCSKKNREPEEENSVTQVENSGESAFAITSLPITTAVAGDILGEATNVDLTTWVPTNLTQSLNSNHVYPDWTITSDSAIQNVNSIPSILLSDIDTETNLISGTFTAGTSLDDDFIGFVFGYESLQKFYQFDWKKVTQSGAEAGISVKRFNATSVPVAADFWSSNGNGTRMTVLYHSSTPWEFDTEYAFTVNFNPGGTKIVIKNGSEIVDEILISDAIIDSGKFGLYVYSQDNVRFDKIAKTPVQGYSYKYQVTTSAVDDVELSYSLLESPEGMKIDQASGLIEWNKEDIVSGEHPIKVQVENKSGEKAEQKYTLTID